MAAVRGSKLKVRTPRKGPAGVGNELDLEAAWDQISQSLRAMHDKNASKLSFEAIYRQAYNIVLKKKGDECYSRLQAFEHDWLSHNARKDLISLLSPSLLSNIQSESLATSVNERRAAGETFMRGMKVQWEDYQIVMSMATDVFMYLDRVYCSDSRKPSIYSSGMILFRNCILRTPPLPNSPNLLNILKRIILEQIAMERDGDVIDNDLIKSCVHMLEGLHETAMEDESERLYLTSFEQDFLATSKVFYEAEGARLIQEADALSYCRSTKKRLDEEEDRCRSTLSPVTAPKIASVIQGEMIENKIKDVIEMENGMVRMWDDLQYDNLHMIYELNGMVDAQKSELVEAIQRRIHQLGEAINKVGDASPPVAAQQSEKGDTEAKPAVNAMTQSALQWVEDILQLKDKIDQLHTRSLESDAVIQPALGKSFTETVNSFGARCAEYISLFIDENMKKGLKDKTDAEVDVVLEKAVVLLRYVQDKDMFELYYKKHLAKRLLMGRSVSHDVEKQMISRMKIELGHAFTSKLETMFKDMALSEELSLQFKDRLGVSEAKRADLGVSILNGVAWPVETMTQSGGGGAKSQVIFPPVVEAVKERFVKFYNEKHSSRKLNWLANMGTADIRATFPKVAGAEGILGKERRHELNVSTNAMIVLMLFNDLPDGASLTYDDIQTKTNIADAELKRNLQSLAVAPKTRILVKEPMSKEVQNTDRFYFNESFHTKFTKIKVGVVTAGNKVEGDRERRETEKRNVLDREYAVDAAVVRIMKQRKHLDHTQLISETITQLAHKFQPDVGMIKKRIESLIEREFLKRSEQSSSGYDYLA